VEAARRAPQGEVVISAPVVVVPLLVPGLGLLRAKYPGLTFSV